MGNRRDAVAKEVHILCWGLKEPCVVDSCQTSDRCHIHVYTRTTIKQILDSEQTFVDQMTTLVAVFIKPLRWWQAEIVGGKASERFGALNDSHVVFD